MSKLDCSETIHIHKNSINRKSFLRHLYRDFYDDLLSRTFSKGPIVEIGSGGGCIKDYYPKVITSDIVNGEGIDRVFSVSKLPFPDNSVAGFVMLDVLHHVKDPAKAFSEMSRSLKKNGKIVMIEPWDSWWGKIIYKYVHSEMYDPTAGWKIKGTGRLTDSNTALPWIIFVRDRALFTRLFPKLTIVDLKPHTPLRYLFSGGLTPWQFAPLFVYPIIKKIEPLLEKYLHMSMFVTIELMKK